MTTHVDNDLLLELKQHQVDAKLHWFELDRRDFLKVLGGGLLVGALVRPVEAQESGRGFGGHELPQELSAWLHISEEGQITVLTGKVEIGQNIRTSLAQQVAEELRVPMESIGMVMGDTKLTPWDAGTFGSRSTPTMAPQLRAAAATARELLLASAAAEWKVQPASLSTNDGKVTNPAGRESLSYGQIAKKLQQVKIVIAQAKLTPTVDWKVAGKPAPKVDGRDFVTGKHQYPSDISRPGMLYGKVLRPAGFKATLVSVETSEAEKQAGVKVVRDGEFIGVTAPDAWSAEQAIAVVRAKWDVPEQPSNANLFEYLKSNLDTSRERSEQPVDLDAFKKALSSADAKLEQTYTVEYIAHCPLEPRAAVAEWDGDSLTVWTGTQRPFGVHDELVEAFRMPPDKVRVIMPAMGSGYGGKHSGECAIEAARLAKGAGKPVKVVWTREEELTWAYFRPAGVIEARSGVMRDGRIVAWEFHNYNSGSSGIATPYNIHQLNIQYHPVKSPLRQGSYRGLAATANHFVRESFMDELAHEVKMEPLQFRLKNLTDERLKAVLDAAADKFGWGKEKSTAERGFGIAGGYEKGSYVAACAEVAIDPKTRKVRIVRVAQAFECGAVVNPNGLRNQVEGAVVQGIGGALFEQVKFANGRILNAHFSEYRLPRLSDLPQIDVVLVDRKDLAAAGAGETPIMGIAPAVGNAIFAASGVRLRKLPMAPEGVVGA